MPQKGAMFIILRPDGTVLMQLRDAKSKFYPNMWCFPGGGCSGDEEPIDTVIREAKEEYGLNLEKSTCRFLMEYQLLLPENYCPTAYIFICPIDLEQEPILNEGVDMKWMKINEIKKIELGFEQKIIIPKLEEFLRFREKV